MILKQVSEKLMSFFAENKCINHSKPTRQSAGVLRRLYDELYAADTFIEGKKKEAGALFYRLTTTKIISASLVPKPSQFNADSFPASVREQIDSAIAYSLTYSFNVFNRHVTIHFLLEDSVIDPVVHTRTYNEYVDKILIWLYIVNEYSSKKCSKRITIFIYMTSLKKVLPGTSTAVLDQTHVNTAFTTTCPVVSEIVVFREEEWFKVLIHETFHNFGLDFSDMNTEACHAHLLSLFPVKSKVNLFEAYCEFWAEIMNVVFCSFYILRNKNDEAVFMTNFNFLINLERTFSFFQMAKVLSFMGIRYLDLYSSRKESVLIRNTLYREKTNVLAYFVVTTVLLNNYQGFLEWCDNNNTALLQFKKTSNNMSKFCDFIEANYRCKSMLSGSTCMESFLDKLKKKRLKDEDVLRTLRMSVCEMW